MASATCPLKSPADWQGLLATVAGEAAWVKPCVDQGLCEITAGPFLKRARSEVADVLSRCTVDVTVNPAIAACTNHLRQFVPAWLNQHGAGYGFRQDNRTYFAAQTGPDTPAGMMDPPPALVAALSSQSAIEAAARNNGWPYLSHQSQLGGLHTFVLIADPAQRFEQWVNVGYGGDPPGSLDSRTSFIAVQKKDASGRELPQVRLHFRDYSVVRDTTPYRIDLPESFEAKCYGCHVSGMRPLRGFAGSDTVSAPVKGEPGYGQPTTGDDFAGQRLASLNQRILSYGLPDWAGTLEPADHGPPLGQALGCTSCHDGKLRGVLTVFASEDLVRTKVVSQVSMRSPAGGKKVPDEQAMALLDRKQRGTPALSPAEEAALAQALAEHTADHDAFVASRYPSWKAWMLETACE